MSGARGGEGPGWEDLPLREEEGPPRNLPLFEEDPRTGAAHRERRAPSRRGEGGGAQGTPPVADGDGEREARSGEPAWVQASFDEAAAGAPETSAARPELPEEGADSIHAAGAANGRRAASGLERLIAGFADLVLHLAVLSAVLVAEALLGLQPEPRQWPGFLVFLLCFSFLYTTVPLAFWGQTPGMAWRGLRARDRGDRPLAFGQTALRWLGGLASLVLVGLPALIAFGGRSLADRLSRSETIAEPSSSP